MNFEELKLQQQTLTTEQLKYKLANSPSLWDEERRAIEAILTERAAYEKPFKVRHSSGGWVSWIGEVRFNTHPIEEKALVLYTNRDNWRERAGFEIVEVEQDEPAR